MNYVPSDFDDLDGGLNILNIVENSTDLAPYEGAYEDKGLGFKQQYSLYGSLNLVLDYFDPQETNLSIDFCYVFKDNYASTTNHIFTLNRYVTGQTTPVGSYDLSNETHIITQDSNGNEVWLWEDIILNNTGGAGPTPTSENDEFAITLEVDYMFVDVWHRIQRLELCSFNRAGYNDTPPDEQPIVLNWIDETTINFTAQKTGGLDGKIYTTFSGTFDNSFIGTTNNNISQISFLYMNPHTHEEINYILERDVDYTVDGNTFYSGTGDSASQIMVNLDEIFPEGISLDISVFTPLNYKSEDNSLGDTLPVFDWGKENNVQYLNVNGKYKLNDTDIITTSGNDVILDVDKYKLNGTDIITTNNNNNYLNKNLKITDNAYYDIDMDMLGKYTRFSTDELVIGKFFDGKPVYRKSFYGAFSHNQTLLSNVDVLVRAYGEGDPGTGLFRQLPYFEYWNGTSYFCNIVHDSTNHTLVVNSYLANSPHNCSMIVTIEYTKTTD